ncbi:hypothetical protein [Salegentibacter chungangensis]|uniref:Uncharacterized protein n=1 Tax=Salegentibacter chungangensis TaxID=1335724 RepID=A0ABW3NU97_9FLAO
MRCFISIVFFILITTGLSAQTNFEVITSEDSGKGSLRQAILMANAAEFPAEISFNIPGPGPHIIKLNEQLPPINKTLKINGFSQPGSSKIYPQILIDCNNTSEGFIYLDEAPLQDIKGVIVITSPEMLAYELSYVFSK